MYNPSIYWSNKSGTPNVIESGASKSINPDILEFVDTTILTDAPAQGVSATKCIGTLNWHFIRFYWSNDLVS